VDSHIIYGTPLTIHSFQLIFTRSKEFKSKSVLLAPLLHF